MGGTNGKICASGYLFSFAYRLVTIERKLSALLLRWSQGSSVTMRLDVSDVLTLLRMLKPASVTTSLTPGILRTSRSICFVKASVRLSDDP